ncbi:MAG: hypothetical protein R2849_23705 [Thermomicrobiales bacterium]
MTISHRSNQPGATAAGIPGRHAALRDGAGDLTGMAVEATIPPDPRRDQGEIDNGVQRVAGDLKPPEKDQIALVASSAGDRFDDIERPFDVLAADIDMGDGANLPRQSRILTPCRSVAARKLADRHAGFIDLEEHHVRFRRIRQHHLDPGNLCQTRHPSIRAFW